MSYILEALKKAEHERRLGDVPHLHVQARLTSMPAEAHTPRSTMVLLVGLATLVVILALLIWLRPWASDSVYTLTIRTTRADPSLQPEPATPALMRAAPPLTARQEIPAPLPAPVAPVGQAAIAAAQPGAQPTVPPVAAPAPPAPSMPEPLAVTRPAKAPPAAAAAAPVAPVQAARQTTASPAAALQSPPEAIPVLRDLPASIQQQIPALAVSGYIYADQPEDRSIIINRKFLREGEQVTPELQLERLTQSGMVLNFRGYRYRAPY